MKKKLLSTLLVLAFAILCIPTLANRAYAADEECKIGNGNYATFAEALDAIKTKRDGGDTAEYTVTLLKEITLSDNCTVPDDTTIALNGYKLKGNGKTLSGTNLKFAIASATDMTNARSLATGKSCLKQVWELQNDILLKKCASCSGIKSLIVNGNGYTITGDPEAVVGDSTDTLLSCSSTFTDTPYVELVLNNLTVKTNDRFQKCIYLQRNLKSTDNTVRLTLKNVVIDNSVSSTQGQGCGIVNNWASIVVEGKCTFKAGKYAWSAIDLDQSKGDVALTFAKGAEVLFDDNRTVLLKTFEPIIDIDGESNTTKCTVTNAESVGLFETTRIGKRGYDFRISGILQNRVQGGKYDLVLNGIHAGVFTFTEEEKGFVLESDEGYLVLDTVSHQLTTTTDYAKATVWQYDGGLYVSAIAGNHGKCGFFRAPRMVRYYLAADVFGQPYARLCFASAKTVYSAYAD